MAPRIGVWIYLLGGHCSTYYSANTEMTEMLELSGEDLEVAMIKNTSMSNFEHT